nr:bacterio-opsin activator domain-containing protein [Halomarina salina]
MLDEATLFRAVAATTSDPLAVLDCDRTVVFANDQFGELFDRPPESVRGEPYEAFVEGGVLPSTAAGDGDRECDATARVEEGAAVRVVARDVEQAGHRLTVVTLRRTGSGSPDDGSGELETETRTETTTDDQDAELRASRERYRRLVDAAPDAIVAADAETGEILDVNEAAVDLFDRPYEDLVGRPQTDLHPPEEADRYREIFDEHAEIGGVLEEEQIREVVRRDGTRVPVEIRAGVTDLPSGSVVQGIFRDVSERNRRQRELAAHRDELARLNRVNKVIREIVQALVDAETRDEVEQTVCERLVDAEPYVFAWMGELAPGRSVLPARAHAGDGGGFVDGDTVLELDADLDCPIRRALTTRSVEVVEDLEATATDEDDWRTDALAEGFRSCAAIPIVHDGRRFGVLTVYSDEVAGFDARECAVLSDLGGALGHALNALERKVALMGDSLLEVELRTTDHVPTLIEEVGEEGRVTFERTIPTTNDHLQYVRVENVSTERFEELLDGYEWCREFRRVRDADPAVYELRATHLDLTSQLYSLGGRIRSAVVEDGAFRIVAELPDDADVRGLVEALGDSNSDIELVAQRTVPRSDHPDRARISLEDTLSDRQQAALEVAYYAGYFEWPRDSTAEDVADSLGVSSPTTHKHLRRAHQRILEQLLERPDLSAGED